MTAYKVLVNNKSCHGGSFDWTPYLPVANDDGTYTPGAWTPDEPVAICSQGWHLTTAPYGEWAKWGMTVYEAEGRGDCQTHKDKSDHASVRLLRPVAHPDWWQRAEQIVDDEIPAVPWCKPDGKPDPAWRLLAGAAAGAAARATARAAARAAARATARAAAGDAAWDAAGAAAGAAAWDAARAAVRAAAGTAARAASRAAVRAAAGAAARDAARDAALYVLIEGVCADVPLDEQYRHHARDRWRVWEKGYALLGDVGGVLYVYAAEDGDGND